LKNKIECNKKTKLKNLTKQKEKKTIKRIRIKSDRKEMINGEISKRVTL
jgi:hypothetical protein